MDKKPHLLYLEGIKGEVVEQGYQDWIYIDSFSWGIQNAKSSKGSARAAGLSKFQAFSVVKALEKSSNPLFMACATGQFIPKGKVVFRRLGKLDPKSGSSTLEPFYEWIFDGLYVVSWQTSGASVGSPTETLSIAFAAVQKSFFSIERGTRKDASRAAFDIRTRDANISL